MRILKANPLLLTDCYNLSHQRLKKDTSWETSHMYNRADGMILYGFQEIATDILSTRITQEMIEQACQVAKRMNLEFPRLLWERVVNECNGYIPIKVECLPEGTYCPKGTPFAQISNTIEGMGEMVTWLEPIFMMAYFPSSCATQALEMRKYLEEKMKENGYDAGFMWRFHSFGFRGHKSLEDAYWAGTAWSMFLGGTDDFHIAKYVQGLPMGSIPALAHKVTQQFTNEEDCYIRAIDQVAGRENIVAIVIDTYDADNFINNHLIPLTKYASDKGVHVVYRPDSGDVFEQAVTIYDKVALNDLKNASVIIGEGMSFENAKEFDRQFELIGVPLNFINYGIGAGFYKHIERDTLGWAMKTAYSNGKPRMKVVLSNPFKQSIPNKVHLIRDENNDLVVCDGESEKIDNEYKTIYEYMHKFNSRYIDYMDDDTHYKEVSEIALAQNTSQKNIILSKETQKLIENIKSEYVGVKFE